MIGLYSLIGGLSGALRMAAAAVVTAGLLLTYDALIDDPAVFRAGEKAERVRQIEDAAKAAEERNKINEDVGTISDTALCRELGGVQCDDADGGGGVRTPDTGAEDG